jgi:glycerol-3-phosphate O-acyltransferase
VPFERRLKLEFYKNNLIHALADLSIVARALLAAGADRAGAAVGAARERARAASRLLKKELIFRPGQGFERAFEETLAWLERSGLVARAGERVAVWPGDGEWLQLIAGLTDSYLESYAVAVSVAAPGRAPTLSERLTPGGGSKGKKDAPSRLMAAGERLLLLGDIQRREALSRPVLENAWAYLREAGALEDRAKLEIVRADLVAAGVTPPPGQGG